MEFQGRTYYLGRYGSKESKAKYQKILAEILVKPIPKTKVSSSVRVGDLCRAFLDHAKSYYSADEYTHYRRCTAFLKPHDTLAESFGPLLLASVRDDMLAYRKRNGEPLTRRYVNQQIGRVRRMFRWGASQEMVSPLVHAALGALAGLRAGKTTAPETDPIEPVEFSAVDATIAHVSPQVASLARFQQLTGCRPGEACVLRPCDVERRDGVWWYRPHAHKMQGRTTKPRIVFLGPKAQELIEPWLDRDPESYCWTPAESEAWRQEQRRLARKTKVQPSQLARRKKRKPLKPFRPRYNHRSYRKAIHDACNKHGLPSWSPNQIRHTVATQVRQNYGLAAAQIVLGHARADVTQVYAERDLSLGNKLATEIG